MVIRDRGGDHLLIPGVAADPVRDIDSVNPRLALGGVPEEEVPQALIPSAPYIGKL